MTYTNPDVTPTANGGELLTLTQAAERLGVDPRTLRAKIASGELIPAVPGMRGRGGAALFTAADVDRLDFSDGGRPRKERKVELAAESLAAIQRRPRGRRGRAWLREATKEDPAAVTAVARRYVTRSDVMPGVEEYDELRHGLDDDEPDPVPPGNDELRDERDEAERKARERWRATRPG